MMRNTREFVLGSSVSVPGNPELSQAAPSTGDKGLLCGWGQGSWWLGPHLARWAKDSITQTFGPSSGDRGHR